MTLAAPELSSAFNLKPLTPTIGAVVEGADLTSPTPALCAALRAALLEWKVLFFYDNILTTAEHIAFGRMFGELEIHPIVPHKPGFPEATEFIHDRKDKGRENVWHSDVTWRPEPSFGSILRAIEIPAVGGDTLFADMYSAYEGLSPSIKARIEGRKAMHDFGYLSLRAGKYGLRPKDMEAVNREHPPVEHPVVRTHPETGRKLLYVNAVFTRRIIGIELDESEQLLKRLYAQAAIPEYQCRFRWRKNAIAFWDNRACQHYAASDYWPAVRRMERVSIVGERPY